MQKIIPYLWFNDQAGEAVELYTSLFHSSRTGAITRYSGAVSRVSGKPEGSLMTLNFTLEGQQFIAINGGPQFSFSPAISFYVIVPEAAEIDRLWSSLSPGGGVMMPLARYPFSEKYGWLQDKFGVSWQFILAGQAHKIAPCLLFVGDQSGKSGEAMNFYLSLFPGSQAGLIARYSSEAPNPDGTIKHAEFYLSGQEFIVMDSAGKYPFGFTGAISFLVNCETQAEIDELWAKFSAGGQPGQCGWIKDRYEVSWQVVPAALDGMVHDPDPRKSGRVMAALMPMKKIDINVLQRAYAGENASPSSFRQPSK